MSSEEAVNKLATAHPGTFIVRFGNNPEYPSAFCVTKVTKLRKTIHIR
jgi:hypothetical protein